MPILMSHKQADAVTACAALIARGALPLDYLTDPRGIALDYCVPDSAIQSLDNFAELVLGIAVSFLSQVVPFNPGFRKPD